MAAFFLSSFEEVLQYGVNVAAVEATDISNFETDRIHPIFAYENWLGVNPFRQAFSAAKLWAQTATDIDAGSFAALNAITWDESRNGRTNLRNLEEVAYQLNIDINPNGLFSDRDPRDAPQKLSASDYERLTPALVLASRFIQESLPFLWRVYTQVPMPLLGSISSPDPIDYYYQPTNPTPDELNVFREVLNKQLSQRIVFFSATHPRAFPHAWAATQLYSYTDSNTYFCAVAIDEEMFRRLRREPWDDWWNRADPGLTVMIATSLVHELVHACFWWNRPAQQVINNSVSEPWYELGDFSRYHEPNELGQALEYWLLGGKLDLASGITQSLESSMNWLPHTIGSPEKALQADLASWAVTTRSIARFLRRRPWWGHLTRTGIPMMIEITPPRSQEAGFYGDDPEEQSFEDHLNRCQRGLYFKF